jgi:CheY-like chemotaxis protein
LLLVEDSEDDVLLLQRALQRYPGITLVARAEDGDVAIAYLSGSGEYADREKHPLPDLMVLDLMMPRRNGLEVLEWMRQMKRRPRVVVFTSSVLDRDKEQAMALGADLFQTKDCQPDSFDRFAHWLSCLCALDRKRQARLDAGGDPSS